MHASHGAIEILAAILLWIGGAAMLVSAFARRRTLRAALVSPSGQPGPTGPTRPLPPRSATLVTAGMLAAGAAVIHLAAGPHHVEELGDLGLGFYWAGLFQGVLAAALVAHGRASPALVGTRVAMVGVLGNAPILVAWAVSRAVGLPGIPGGPEAVGLADVTAAVLEVALVGLLLGRCLPPGVLRSLPHVRAESPELPTRSGLATSMSIVVTGVAILVTSFAAIDAVAGHAHDDDDHGMNGTPHESDGTHRVPAGLPCES